MAFVKKPGDKTTVTQTYATTTSTVPTVTAATPTAATAVATGISTAVTGVDGTGSNAASKADVDTRLGTLSTCVTALLVDIASLRTQLTAANADILANRKLINLLVDQNQAMEIML